MPIFASVLLFVGFSCVVFATILVVVFKQPDISCQELLAKGSTIFRDLNAYVASNMVKPIYALIYCGLSILVAVIFGLLIFKTLDL
ncbi:hypothetical protein [Pseudoalteromonas sp. T1lg22]|uniref:hypothetical protein n=1 Tax=Pseudoalteromonas sp. T1lg22 TaxID=2077096 RepID=UPI000CF637FE|nr:hypothetical protein [Pseudoalteromonas sp. T1lg22]